MRDKLSLYRIIALALIIIWGAIQAWNSRFELYFADSQQYFDMAGYYSRGEFGKAISLYWSPLYSAIFGLILRLVPVSPYWQFFELKVFNFICLLCAFFAFEFFFAGFYKYYPAVILAKDPDRQPISKESLGLTAYTLFVTYALAFGGVNQDTPDMLNAALMFLASGLMLAQLSSDPNKLTSCLLGVTLGFGYLCKAVMVPLTAVYIGLTFLFNRNIVSALLSAVCFAVVAAPWVWTMSVKSGHFSFGESGKFVYINHVEDINPVWTDGVINRPDVLYNEPRVLLYGDRVPGTTPIMYDYGFWSAGAVVHFRLHQILRALACNIFYYLHTFLYLPILVMAVAWSRARTWPLPARALYLSAPVWVPSLAVCTLCAVVGNLYLDTYITRYFIAVYPMAMLGVLAALRVPRGNPAASSLLRNLCLVTVILSLLSAFSTRLIGDVADLFSEKRNIWYETAMVLKRDGINNGAPIAQLGVRIQRNYQYAEPEKLRVIANIEDEKQFWKLPPDKRAEVLEIVRKSGARAVVYARIPDVEDPILTADLKLLRLLFNFDVKLPFKSYMPPTDLRGWKQVPGCEIYYYPFN